MAGLVGLSCTFVDLGGICFFAQVYVLPPVALRPGFGDGQTRPRCGGRLLGPAAWPWLIVLAAPLQRLGGLQPLGGLWLGVLVFDSCWRQPLPGGLLEHGLDGARHLGDGPCR